MTVCERLRPYGVRKADWATDTQAKYGTITVSYQDWEYTISNLLGGEDYIRRSAQTTAQALKELGVNDAD